MGNSEELQWLYFAGSGRAAFETRESRWADLSTQNEPGALCVPKKVPSEKQIFWPTKQKVYSERKAFARIASFVRCSLQE